MGFFGGEKYSKSAFQEAEREVADAGADLDRIGVFAGMVGARGLLEDEAKNAKKRIEKLYGKGQQEAMDLNTEHDRLMADALDAVKKLQEFEINKLGMSGGD